MCLFLRAGDLLGFLSFRGGAWPTTHLGLCSLYRIIVWWGADLVRTGQAFANYAVLGDDVLIADEAVALEYRRSLSSGCR